jgi:hypothetical protein
MKRWIIGWVVGACVGVGVYLLVTRKPAAAPTNLPDAPAVAVAPATPAAPVVLAEVVEVTDLDPLLDPPAKPVVGAPFDAEPATVPVSVPNAPQRIPPAVNEPEIAPMPREVDGIGAIRAFWYGPAKLPWQLGCWDIHTFITEFLYSNSQHSSPVMIPRGFWVGVGYFY